MAPPTSTSTSASTFPRLRQRAAPGDPSIFRCDKKGKKEERTARSARLTSKLLFAQNRDGMRANEIIAEPPPPSFSRRSSQTGVCTRNRSKRLARARAVCIIDWIIWLILIRREGNTNVSLLVNFYRSLWLRRRFRRETNRGIHFFPIESSGPRERRDDLECKSDRVAFLVSPTINGVLRVEEYVDKLAHKSRLKCALAAAYIR